MTLITSAPQLKDLSFYEACAHEHIDGADICDNDWDWGIFLSVPEAKTLDECEDAYDKFCLLLALNLRCKGINREWYTACDVCGFIEANRKVFEKFFNEENREGYRPMDYDNPQPDEDEGYFEAFMQPMESLIAGNYCESNYQRLVDELTGKSA